MMTMLTQSESLSDNITEICRLCLRREGSMSSIFGISGSGDEDFLATRITSIAQVQISPTDGLPESICHVCRQEVNKFYDFRLLVEISDQKLRSCLQGDQTLSEFLRDCINPTDHNRKEAYEESSEENICGEQDLVSVDTILLSSTGEMQVRQISIVEDNIVSEKNQVINSISDENVQLEYSADTNSSDFDDYEGVKRCLAQSVTPLEVNAIKNENEFSFRAATSVSDEVQSDYVKIIGLELSSDEDTTNRETAIDEYSCQLCFKSFQCLGALKNHVGNHLLSNKRRSSSDIERDQEDEISFVKEEIYDIDNINKDGIVIETEFVDSLTCQSCDENFETMEERLLHSQRDLGALVFKCRHCEELFLKMSLRKGHEEIVHGTRMSGKTHKCDECGQEFAKRSELRYHKGTHTMSPSVCSICNKNFRNVQSFKMHLKRHTLGSRYNCTDCGKSYYTNSELARHVQQHKGKREFPCNLCDMSFLSRPELNRHVKYHNGVKKFKCKVCSKTYYESGHLKVHERVHTGERPFTCTICGKGFITKSKLVRHLKIHDRTDHGRGSCL